MSEYDALSADADALIAIIDAAADPRFLDGLDRQGLIDRINHLSTIAKDVIRTNEAAGHALMAARERESNRMMELPPAGTA